MKFDLLQHYHDTVFHPQGSQALSLARSYMSAGWSPILFFFGLCSILQRPSTESSNLVSPGRVYSVATRMSLHVHDHEERSSKRINMNVTAWRWNINSVIIVPPHPPGNPPSNDQRSNMNVTSWRASTKERCLPHSTPPHSKHWRTWYEMHTNTPCLWEVRSKKCAFSARPRHHQTKYDLSYLSHKKKRGTTKLTSS